MGKPAHYHAFLSYSRASSQEAKVLVEYLRGSGLRICWDQDFLPGDMFRHNIEEKINACHSLLFMIDRHGLTQWQEIELDIALQKISSKKKSTANKVYPILLPGVDITSQSVPVSLKGYNITTFTKSIDHEVELIQKLIAALFSMCLDGLESLERPIQVIQADLLIRETVNFYDANAERFLEAWRDRIPMGDMEPFLKLLKGKSKILDAGCGPGHHAKYLASLGHEVVAIDLSNNALAVARKYASHYASNVLLMRMDIRNLSLFESNSFDAIWASASSVHIPREQITSVLLEYIRILRPGGVLGMSVHIEKPAEKKADGRFFEMYKSANEVRMLLKFVGFEVLNDNTQVSRDNTMGQRRVKKWAAIRARAPLCKNIITII